MQFNIILIINQLYSMIVRVIRLSGKRNFLWVLPLKQGIQHFTIHLTNYSMGTKTLFRVA